MGSRSLSNRARRRLLSACGLERDHSMAGRNALRATPNFCHARRARSGKRHGRPYKGTVRLERHRPELRRQIRNCLDCGLTSTTPYLRGRRTLMERNAETAITPFSLRKKLLLVSVATISSALLGLVIAEITIRHTSRLGYV